MSTPVDPEIRFLLSQVDELTRQRNFWNLCELSSSGVIALGVAAEFLEMFAERWHKKCPLHEVPEWISRVAFLGALAVVIGLFGETYCSQRVDSRDNQIGALQSQVFQIENQDINSSLQRAQDASNTAQVASLAASTTSASLDYTARRLETLARRVTPKMLGTRALTRISETLRSCSLKKRPTVLVEASGQNNVGETIYLAAKRAGLAVNIEVYNLSYEGAAESKRDGNPEFRGCLERALNAEGISSLHDSDDNGGDGRAVTIWVGYLYESSPRYTLKH